MALKGHDDMQGCGGTTFSMAVPETTSCSPATATTPWMADPGDDYLDGRGGGDTLTGGPGRDTFAYYAKEYDKEVDNGRDTVTDFDGAVGDALLLSGFVRAEVEVRAEGSDTVADLPGPAKFALRGVVQLDGDDLCLR